MSVTVSPEGRAAPTPTRFLPHHRIGWAAFASLLAICLAPAWWAKLDDVLPRSRWGDLGMLAVAVVLPVTSIALARKAIFRKKDPSVLLSVAFALAAVVVIIGVLLVPAMVGVLVFGG